MQYMQHSKLQPLFNLYSPFHQGNLSLQDFTHYSCCMLSCVRLLKSTPIHYLNSTAASIVLTCCSPLLLHVISILINIMNALVVLATRLPSWQQ
jgi:hypothetical protein